MKVGDLVEFHSNSWVFEFSENERYFNPGVILTVEKDNSGSRRYEVLWSDGGVTREHYSFIQTAGTTAKSNV